MRRWSSAWRRRWSTSMPAVWSRTRTRSWPTRSSASFSAVAACRGRWCNARSAPASSSTRGLVVTNYHVIEDADEVKIALSDKREFPADIVLKDQRPTSRCCASRARARLPTLAFANSDELQVGDVVLAIGDPFGVDQTVTAASSRRWGAPTSASRLRVLHPDRRRHQSRQLRRRPRRPERRGHRHQPAIYLASGARHRLRHPRQHGAGRRHVRGGRQRPGEAAMARRQAAGGHAGNRRELSGPSARAARWSPTSPPTAPPPRPASRPAT